MIIKSSIGFLTTSSDAMLVKTVQAFLLSLTNNPNFPKTSPTQDVVAALLAEFITAMALAAQGLKGSVAAKNAKRRELEALLRKLANYLTDESNGDLSKLETSGFPMQKPTRNKIGVLDAPESPVLKHGKKAGEIEGKIKGVYGAVSYVWQVALSSSPEVAAFTFTSAGGSATLRGLKAGQLYSVRVRAIGSAGPSDFGDDAEIMAL